MFSLLVLVLFLSSNTVHGCYDIPVINSKDNYCILCKSFYASINCQSRDLKLFPAFRAEDQIELTEINLNDNEDISTINGVFDFPIVKTVYIYNNTNICKSLRDFDQKLKEKEITILSECKKTGKKILILTYQLLNMAGKFSSKISSRQSDYAEYGS